METHSNDRIVLEIYQDPEPEDPRNDDNLGIMWCQHRRYNLGDRGAREPDENITLALPLYLYNHSGLWMSTSNARWPFNSRWDAGQVGYIYTTIERILEWFGVEEITDELLSRAKKTLIAEVEIYNMYISGQVFCYALYELDTCPCCGNVEKVLTDSMCGLYDISAMEDYLPKEALELTKGDGESAK